MNYFSRNVKFYRVFVVHFSFFFFRITNKRERERSRVAIVLYMMNFEFKQTEERLENKNSTVPRRWDTVITSQSLPRDLISLANVDLIVRN